jgi:hypothetical protein
MTYYDMLEIVEYLDEQRKETPGYAPTEYDNQQLLLDFLAIPGNAEFVSEQ